MKNLYLLSDKLKWSDFRVLQKKLVKDSGPTPDHGNRMIWELMKDKRIFCWFASDMKDDMGIGLVIPRRYKKWKISIISSPKTNLTQPARARR